MGQIKNIKLHIVTDIKVVQENKMEVYMSGEQYHYHNNNKHNIDDNNNNNNDVKNDIDDDGGISAVHYPATNDDVRGKPGFFTNAVNRFDKKQRRFTHGNFATQVGINGIVNGMRENYTEFNPNATTQDSTSTDRKQNHYHSVTENKMENEQNSDKPTGKFSGKSLSLSENLTAFKEKMSPTGIKLPPGLSKMKNSFTGRRKETASTYVAANLRRGSDVQSLVDDDGPYVSEWQPSAGSGTDLVSY